ncbi:hypothetical protein FOZ60_007992 [Perkinsus olseni]|uniref:Uncharacterized protein n=1 Tax=Perkinsus olseni TaxID=32597 RepID=A0A7J6NLA7_PEROL|nr:hypothetical protein FOZ60_007992 [Perkinsus olseni]KAF4734008.1 hypothetical protein FOZ62_031324 [Perkinsus olseni]
MVHPHKETATIPHFPPLKARGDLSRVVNPPESVCDGRVIVVGNSGVGKTKLVSLLRKLLSERNTTFPEELLKRKHPTAHYLIPGKATIGVDYVPLTLRQGKEEKTIGVWDCGGYSGILTSLFARFMYFDIPSFGTDEETMATLRKLGEAILMALEKIAS